MYAIIKTGGKQYRVSEKDTLRVEKIDAKPGDTVDSAEVLAVADGDQVTFGAPQVDGAKVTLKVLGQERGNKVKAFKFRKRKGYKKTIGHRQSLTRVSVEKIEKA